LSLDGVKIGEEEEEDAKEEGENVNGCKTL